MWEARNKSSGKCRQCDLRRSNTGSSYTLVCGFISSSISKPSRTLSTQASGHFRCLLLALCSTEVSVGFRTSNQDIEPLDFGLEKQLLGLELSGQCAICLAAGVVREKNLEKFAQTRNV